jgi:MFS family permease
MVTATGDAFRPANSASISTYSSKENYPQAIALNRLAMNLGFTVGPILGGLLATVSYTFLFWADGLTCIFAAAFIWFVLPTPVKKIATSRKDEIDTTEKIDEDTPSQKAVKSQATQGPYKDTMYMAFLVFTTLYATAFF